MTLLENSTSFFVESIKKAVEAESETKEWKFALLLLVQAIETCLKERLRQTNEAFLFTNIDKPKLTVDIRLALDRLKNISKLTLSQNDIESIKTASYLRNQIVHFEFDLSVDQIKSIFVKLIGFYTSFCQEHLKTEVTKYLPEPLHKEILSLDNYVSELLQRAEERIKKEEIPEEYVWLCNVCNNFTLVINDDINTCYLCNHKQAVSTCDKCGELEYEDELTENYVGNYKRLHVYEYICRNCHEVIESEHLYEDY